MYGLVYSVFYVWFARFWMVGFIWWMGDESNADNLCQRGKVVLRPQTLLGPGRRALHLLSTSQPLVKWTALSDPLGFWFVLCHQYAWLFQRIHLILDFTHCVSLIGPLGFDDAFSLHEAAKGLQPQLRSVRGLHPQWQRVQGLYQWLWQAQGLYRQIHLGHKENNCGAPRIVQGFMSQELIQIPNYGLCTPLFFFIFFF